MENCFYGPVYAKVTNNTDPEKLGRVKVSLNVLGDQMESDWMDVMNVYSGSFIMPEIDDQVVVAFMGGNMSAGVVLGGIWSGSKKPPESGEGSGSDFNEDGKNLMKYFKTKGSNRIIFNDKSGEEKIQMINAMGINKLELAAKNKEILVESLISVVIKASDELTIKADKGTIKAANKLKISGKPVTIEGKKNIKFEAKQLAEVKGKTVKLN